MSTTNRTALPSDDGDELLSDSGPVEPAPPTLPAAVAPPSGRRLSRPVDPPKEHITRASHALAPRRSEDELDDEPAPETLRSSVSGHEPVSRPIVIEMDEDHRAA